MKFLLIIIGAIYAIVSEVASRPTSSSDSIGFYKKPRSQRVLDTIIYNNELDPEIYSEVNLLYWNTNTKKAVMSFADNSSGRWLFGLVNEKGDMLSPAVWPEIKNYSSDVAVVLTSTTNTKVDFYGSFYLINDGLSGAVDTEGKIVIPLIYTYLDTFFDSAAIFSTHPFLPRIYKKMQKQRVKTIYPYAKVGIMDNKGNILVPEIYDYINFYWRKGSDTEVVYIVRNNGRWGSIDKYGNILVSIKYRDYRKVYKDLEKLGLIYISKE